MPLENSALPRRLARPLAVSPGTSPCSRRRGANKDFLFKTPEVTTAAGRLSAKYPRPPGGRDERHGGEDADRTAGALPAEPAGRACGLQSTLLLQAGRPHPRRHCALVQARRWLGRQDGVGRGACQPAGRGRASAPSLGLLSARTPGI